MTNRESIEILNDMNFDGGWQFHCAKCAGNCKTCNIGQALDLAIKALEERPQGEWIWITEPDGFLHSKCSKCNQFNDWGDVPYCPWCGAKMGGKGNAKT